MIFKYIISISGDLFNPEEILDKIQEPFFVNSYFKPQDYSSTDLNRKYNYGSLSFWHSKKYSTQDELMQYEIDFLDFIRKNYLTFIQSKVTDFEIFIEIYFDGEQCNFEIFTKDILRELGKIGVSLPISVYVLNKSDIQSWEQEVKDSWKED